MRTYEKEELLHNILIEEIKDFSLENEITFTQIVGVLELVKREIIKRSEDYVK